MKFPPGEVLDALAAVAWPILRSYFRADCCIAASRVGVQVLQRFGIAAQPTVVLAIAGNASYERWFAGGEQGDPPDDARVVLIDAKTERPNGYPAHLILTGKARGDHFLLDLSAPQFHRPDKQIHLPAALYCDLPEPFQAGTVRLPEDGFIAYERYASETLTPFEQSPDWYIRPHHRPIFETAVAEMVAAVVEQMRALTEDDQELRTGT